MHKILQDFMKTNNAWNIRRLVNNLFVPGRGVSEKVSVVSFCLGSGLFGSCNSDLRLLAKSWNHIVNKPFFHNIGTYWFILYKGSLRNTNFCLCIPTDIELSYRLLLSLHSVIAVSVYPSLINSWAEHLNISKIRNWGHADVGCKY